MTRKKIPENKKSQRTGRGNSGRDPIPWRYCLLTLGCGSILVVGFFFAARQHFSSIDFGIKNSRLRKQIENLEGDKRRFMLAKEIALSPAEVKKAAQKIGFREMTASNIEVYRPANNVKDKQKTSLIEKPKQTFLSDVVEPKKEDKKPEKDVKKTAEKDENKSSEIKDKPKTQLAKK
ncbi:MAG: hypothetical protein LH472_02260 [Pyrinomonadaceae bacterium]|nr:hypothetical protein [Pyrinomonadaceae bacterium]